MAMTPKPKLLVAAADGTLRNQPREVTWLRTESRIASWALARLPCCREIPDRAGRLATEQAGQQHHLVRGCRPVRVDQGDLEVVLAHRSAPSARRARPGR